jgi:hypothetical protein
MVEMQYILARHSVTIRPPPTASLCANQSKGGHSNAYSSPIAVEKVS